MNWRKILFGTFAVLFPVAVAVGIWKGGAYYFDGLALGLSAGAVFHAWSITQ